MSASLVFWIAAAVLLFWAVGAYNRMIRLRAAALLAFAGVEAPLRAQAEFVRSCLPPSTVPESAQEDDLLDDMSSLWSGLGAAASQFAASLTVAKNRPLDPHAIAALHAAIGVLHMAWQRMQQDDTHDLAGAALPESLQSQWQQIDTQQKAAAVLFNEAVDRYNGAIVQFPALLLAWFFGLRPARAL